MKFATIATAIAAIAPLASAAGYNAAWTIMGAACDGKIKLGEYTANNATCTPVDCKPIEGETAFSTKTTCVADHKMGANEMLKANPYVLVEVYADDSDCKGDFAIAIAVTADGTCYPGTNGKASYNVTWSAETGTVWKQYTNGKCEGTAVEVPFTPAAADGKTCTAKKLIALAVAPSNSSGSMADMEPSAGATTMPPGMETSETNTSTSGNASASSNTSSSNATTSAPAAAKSAASSTMVGVAVAAGFAVATAALV